MRDQPRSSREGSAPVLVATVPLGVRAWLAGPDRVGRVVGHVENAWYAEIDGRIVALLGLRAVRVPCGLALAVELPTVDPCGPARIGGGRFSVGGLTVCAGRFVDRRVPRLTPPRLTVLRLTAADRSVGSTGLPGLAAAGTLVGRGAGLTPEGDDVLAGFLVAAVAFGLPVEPLRRWVCSTARQRTTAVSAALLEHAADGEAIPELAAYVLALAGYGDATGAYERLAAVGHSSGRALARGADEAALHALTRAAA
ncbi:MAG: DUF2877 domain-containing protein [Actinobacteria bacterium]|nr:DUF2877 domain-containing protein [Actinomycetota bacterium]